MLKLNHLIFIHLFLLIKSKNWLPINALILTAMFCFNELNTEYCPVKNGVYEEFLMRWCNSQSWKNRIKAWRVNEIQIHHGLGWWVCTKNVIRSINGSWKKIKRIFSVPWKSLLIIKSQPIYLKIYVCFHGSQSQAIYAGKSAGKRNEPAGRSPRTAVLGPVLTTQQPWMSVRSDRMETMCRPVYNSVFTVTCALLLELKISDELPRKELEFSVGHFGTLWRNDMNYWTYPCKNGRRQTMKMRSSAKLLTRTLIIAPPRVEKFLL